jgi:hypothetical protein
MSKPSEEYSAFDGLICDLLKVSKADLKAKMDAHKTEAAKNPNRRGPRRKDEERRVLAKRKGRKGPRKVTRPSDASRASDDVS